MRLLELPYFALGTPSEIAAPGVPEIGMGGRLEATGRVEARGQFVGERLVVDKAVCLCRADGLFVQVHGIERAAFDPGDLRPDQCGAVLEILRAIRRPDLELSVVRDQSLDMLLALVCRCGVAGSGAGQRAVEVILRGFE